MLSSGKIIFHGPRELILPFFQSIGFDCPLRKGVAEFLQEVPTLTGDGASQGVCTWGYRGLGGGCRQAMEHGPPLAG